MKAKNNRCTVLCLLLQPTGEKEITYCFGIESLRGWGGRRRAPERKEKSAHSFYRQRKRHEMGHYATVKGLTKYNILIYIL